MSSFFLKLSSKVDELLFPKPEIPKPEIPKPEAPELEDWNGWCEEVAEYSKKQSDRNQELALVYEEFAIYYKKFKAYNQSMHKKCEELVLSYGNKRCWYEEEVRFHQDIARFHREEAAKHGPCSDLHEDEARFYEDRARFHQDKVNECKRVTACFEDWISLIKEDHPLIKDSIHFEKDRSCYFRELASLYQAWTMNSKYNVDADKKVDAHEKEIKICRKELHARWKESFVRNEKLKDYHKKNVGVSIDLNRSDEWDARDKAQKHFDKLQTVGKSLDNHQLQLLQHPDVVKRRELIRILQGIYKVLSKRNHRNSLFLQNENTASLQNHIYAIKLVLNWLESSIFRELGVLGIKVVMTM
jgi:hypothetical protein